MKVAIVTAIILALVVNVLSAETDNERKANLDRLKQDFDTALDRFVDREAAQLCVALTGKADIGVLLERIKATGEFSSLDQKTQTVVGLG